MMCLGAFHEYINGAQYIEKFNEYMWENSLILTKLFNL